jgi:aminopeptidase N
MSQDGYAMAGVEGFLDDAAETKGISMFHVHLLAVTPATHTDEEADESLRLIAHEYFHNASGGYVHFFCCLVAHMIAVACMQL